MNCERRNAIELRTDGKRLIGYAAVFDSKSEDLGGFTEIIRPGAFRRSLSEQPDVPALYEHDRRSILGRTKSGTLRLIEDQRGLKFEIDMPNTTLGRDVLELVSRGDVSGASFAFRAVEEKFVSDGSSELRELLDVDLLDVTITPSPAYPETEVHRRALQDVTLRTRYLELLRQL